MAEAKLTIGLAKTDPELTEVFDNFSLDEVPRRSDLSVRTRLMVQLASMIASQALREYRVMLGAALNVGAHRSRNASLAEC